MNMRMESVQCHIHVDVEPAVPTRTARDDINTNGGMAVSFTLHIHPRRMMIAKEEKKSVQLMEMCAAMEENGREQRERGRGCVWRGCVMMSGR